MKSDTFTRTGEEESRPIDDLSPPGSVHEFPSPTDATGAAVAQEADSSAPRTQEHQQATGENVVSCSGVQPSSSSTDSNDVDGNKAKDEASGSSKLNVEMSVNSSYSRVDDKLRITIDLSVPMRSASRHIDGVNVKLVDSEFSKVVRPTDDRRQSQLQPRCSLTSRYERPIIPMMTELEFEWNEYRRRPSIPDISVDVNVHGDAASGSEAAAASAATVKEEAVPVTQKPPRQQTTPEPPTQNQPRQEANTRAVQEEAPRGTNFDLEDIEKMLGIIPQVEKPSLLDKPGPVGAFAQTSNFVMNEPLKKMVEKQQQLRDKARATSRPAATEAAASVPAPVAFRDSRSTTTSTATTTSTKTTTTTKTSSTQNDPPSYSTCVSENDPARDQQRPSLIQYAPPSYSAAVTAELQNSTESFMSLLEQQRLTSSSSSSSSSAAETAARTSTPNLATFLRPPRTSPRPMISPSAPPHPANPEAEFYNNVIETAMKRAGPFANQLDIKTVLANARHPLMPEPWVPRPMRPYIIGNEEPYRGPETAAEYLERLAEVRSAQVAAVTAQQRPPQRTADLTVGDQGAVPRPPAPRTPNPELRVEASPPAYQRSEWDLRVFPEPSPERSEYDLRVQRAPPAAPSLELDQSSVACDLGTDLRNSLLRAGLPLDLQNLSEAEYDRALTEMHRVMERAKSMLQNLRR